MSRYTPSSRPSVNHPHLLHSLSLSLCQSWAPHCHRIILQSTFCPLVFWSELRTLNQEATQGVPCDAHRGPHGRHRLREDDRRVDLSGRRPRGHRPRRDLAPSHENRALGVPEGRSGLRKGHPRDRRERQGETSYRGASTHPLPPPPSLSLSLSLSRRADVSKSVVHILRRPSTGRSSRTSCSATGPFSRSLTMRPTCP